MAKDLDIWKDREVRFDLKPNELELRNGEEVFHVHEDIEDVKGGDGNIGQLRLSNRRICWIDGKKRKVNWSIGLKCVISVTQTGKTGKTCVCILTKFNGSRFEFILASKSDDVSIALRRVEGLVKAYERSRPCREVLVRDRKMVSSAGQLRLQHEEVVTCRLENVYNVGSGDSVLGVMTITNIRVAWWSQAKPKEFNVSVPYLMIAKIGQVDSKYGLALSVVTSEAGGSYNLGFRIEPASSLQNTLTDLTTYWQSYQSCPLYGVAFDPNHLDAVPDEKFSDDEGVVAGTSSEKGVEAGTGNETEEVAANVPRSDTDHDYQH